MGLRSQRGATWVMNSAMPRLIGTARTRAMSELRKRAVDERQRPEDVGGRVPVVGEEDSSPMSENAGCASRVVTRAMSRG